MTNQPVQEQSQTRSHADGALELLSDVTVEPISQAGYAVPSDFDEPVVVNPAASMNGDRSETVASVNLGMVQDLHTMLSKRSRDDETDATQPKRSRRKSNLSKRTSAIAVVSTAVVALMAYAVMTSERLLARSFSAPETGIPLPQPPAPPPPVLPWPSVHWEKRSNAPACRDNGWIEKNTKACVAADGDSEVTTICSHMHMHKKPLPAPHTICFVWAFTFFALSELSMWHAWRNRLVPKPRRTSQESQIT
eukprot:COSAG02_NODE_246_length_27291_cov_105.654200_17_plen_250_part_00